MKWYNFFRNESRWVSFPQKLFTMYEFNTYRKFVVIGCIYKLYKNNVLDGLKFFPQKEYVYCEKRFNFTIYSKPKTAEIKAKGKGGFTPVEVIARIDFNYDNIAVDHYNIYRYKKENGLYIYDYYMDSFELLDNYYNKLIKN